MSVNTSLFMLAKPTFGLIIYATTSFAFAQNMVGSQPFSGARAFSNPSHSDAHGVHQTTVYRDPSIPLTIDDLAEVYRKKSEEDFYKKNGFTDKKPPPAPKNINLKKQPVTVSMRVLTLFSMDGKTWGEVSVSGNAMRIFRGQKITPFIAVSDITPQKVVLKQIPASAVKCESNPKLRGCKAVTPSIIALAAGDTHSWKQ